MDRRDELIAGLSRDLAPVRRAPNANVLALGWFLWGRWRDVRVRRITGELGQLIAVLFPVLDYFNIQAAVAAGMPVPHAYLALALVYCVVYSTVAMLAALVLFENRDLA